jgi:YD repeat-containing protein
MARESTVYNGPGGAVVSRKVTEPWQSAATASRTINGDVVQARFTRAAATHDRTVLTNALSHVTTTTIDPAWGLPIEVVDPNGKKTEATYDGLGRLTAVWNPGRDKATQTANSIFSYLVSNTAPSAVGTSTRPSSCPARTSATPQPPQRPPAPATTPSQARRSRPAPQPA